MIKDQLKQALDELYKIRAIKSYEIITKEEDRGNGYATAVATLKVDHVELASVSKKFNTERQRFNNVSDLLLGELKMAVLTAGIMGLISNKYVQQD